MSRANRSSEEGEEEKTEGGSSLKVGVANGKLLSSSSSSLGVVKLPKVRGRPVEVRHSVLSCMGIMLRAIKVTEFAPLGPELARKQQQQHHLKQLNNFG